MGGALRRSARPNLDRICASSAHGSRHLAEFGLRFPPKVEYLPRQARSTVADATRLSIRLTESSPSWWLLHELAHAMTSTADGQSDGHGPKFMGLYVKLLGRYLRLPVDASLMSLEAADIEVDMRGEPIFVDGPPVR